MAECTTRWYSANRMYTCFFLALLFAATVDSHKIIVPLSKQMVPITRDGKVVAHKTAYFGTLYVGSPVQQEFTAVFDTGSGHLLLPSTLCKSTTCRDHRRYNRTESLSAIDIDHDGKVVDPLTTSLDEVAISFGTGEVVGSFVYDEMCLAPLVGDNHHDCVRMRVITARKMSEEPFSAFAFDGVLGLGLQSLALDPEFSFLGQIARLNTAVSQHIFGVYISPYETGMSEIAFGGYNEDRVSSSLFWVDVVNPQKGYWQIQVRGVRIGNQSLELCEQGTCLAILDTGTSLLGVPREAAQGMHLQLAREVPDAIAEHGSELDCRGVPGPELVLDLGGFEVAMGAEDYSRPAPMYVSNATTGTNSTICRSSLLPVDVGAVLGGPAFIFGEPLLRKYYTAYNWSSPSVGFSRVRLPPAPEDAAAGPPSNDSLATV